MPKTNKDTIEETVRKWCEDTVKKITALPIDLKGDKDNGRDSCDDTDNKAHTLNNLLELHDKAVNGFNQDSSN